MKSSDDGKRETKRTYITSIDISVFETEKPPDIILPHEDDSLIINVTGLEDGHQYHFMSRLKFNGENVPVDNGRKQASRVLLNLGTYAEGNTGHLDFVRMDGVTVLAPLATIMYPMGRVETVVMVGANDLLYSVEVGEDATHTAIQMENDVMASRDFMLTPPQVEEPVESQQPAESTEPVESQQPTESPEPAESQQPTESPEPAESQQPAESTEPVESQQPAESPEPDESQQPAESPEPAESQQPTESPEPTESQQPTESPEPAESQQPAESTEPVESQRPAPSPEPTQTSTPSPTPRPSGTPAPSSSQSPAPGVSPTAPDEVIPPVVDDTPQPSESSDPNHVAYVPGSTVEIGGGNGQPDTSESLEPSSAVPIESQSGNAQEQEPEQNSLLSTFLRVIVIIMLGIVILLIVVWTIQARKEKEQKN